MATDAQGRQLSEDGYYYWDGTAWQPVQGDSAAQGASPGGLDQALAQWDGVSDPPEIILDHIKSMDRKQQPDNEKIASYLSGDKEQGVA